MASLTQWTWVWVDSRSWWWTGRSGVLRFMGSRRVRHDWATELNWLYYVLELYHYCYYTQFARSQLWVNSSQCLWQYYMHAKSLQLCPTLCDPVDCRLLCPWRFSRQEYWSGLPYSPSGDLPDPGVEPVSPMAPALQADSLPLSHRGGPVTILDLFISKQLFLNSNTLYAYLFFIIQFAT